MELEQVGVRLALLGRGEYLAGLAEASRGLDGFAGRTNASGAASAAASTRTDAHKGAIDRLRTSTLTARNAQVDYEVALKESAAADRQAAESATAASAARKKAADEQVVASRVARDSAVAEVGAASAAVKAEEDVAERTRLAGVKKVSTWEAFRRGVVGNSSGIKAASLGVAEAEAVRAREIEAANARKIASFSSLTHTAGLVAGGMAIASGAVIVETSKMAAGFDASMERIHTQAGVPQAKLGELKQAVLGVAGAVGFDPDNLADAMFHIQSSFAGANMTTKQTSDILTAAAKGAAMGGADLVDVTNALDAAVVSGIPGVQDYNQAMGALNATVGAGDMKMQDLANAMGTGVLAVIKGYGATMRDASAALAVFGDNNIRGSLAGNQLRMSVQALTSPTKDGKKQLEALGMTADQLAKDMQHGGLNQAMTDLHGRMQRAGITGVQTGKWLTDAFGKRAGAGVSILMGQYDRFQQKLGEVDKGAKNFNEDWTRTSETAAQKSKQFHGALDALGVQMGNVFLPVVTKVTDWLGKAVSFFARNKDAAVGLAIVVASVLVASLITLGVVLWATGIAEIALIVFGIVLAVAALAFGIYMLIAHWSTVWGAVKKITLDVWHAITGAVSDGWHKVTGFFSSMGSGIMNAVHAIGRLPGWLVDQWHKVVAFFKALPGNIVEGLGVALGATVRWLTELPGRIRSFAHDAGTWLRDTGRRVVTGLRDGIVNGYRAVVDWFTALPGRVRTFLRDAGTWLRNTGRDILTGLRDGIVAGYHFVVDWFKAAPGNIRRNFTNAARWLVDTGRDILRGLRDGLVNAEHSVIDWVKGLIDRFLTGFKRGLGIASPSKVFAGFGGDIINGLLNGLRQLVQTVVDFFVGFAKRLARGFQNEINTVVSVAKWLWSQLSDIFSKIGAVFRGLYDIFIRPVVDLITRAIRGFANIWHGFYTGDWQPVTTAVGNTFRWLHDTFIKPVSDLILRIIRVIGQQFQLMYDSVWKPVGDALGRAFQAVYDNVIKPVSDKVNSVIHSTGQTFSDIVDWIKRTWQTVSDIVSTPVRFVVNVVYGKAIKPTWDAIAGVFGLPPAPAGPAFASGGVVDDDAQVAAGAGMMHAASGRIMPGYEPGRDRFTIRVGGGEAIMVPEWTRSMLQHFGPSAIDMMNAEARAGRHPMGGAPGTTGHGQGRHGDTALDGWGGLGAAIGNAHARRAGPASGGVRGGTQGRGYADGGMVGTMGAGQDLPAVRLPQTPAVSGLASDVLHSLGSIFDIPELFTDPGGYLHNIFRPITDPLAGMGSSEFMKSMQAVPGKAIDGMVSKIEEAVASMFAGPIAGGGAPAGVVRGWIEQALGILHWPMNYEGGIYQQIMTESGGNPGAVQHGYTDVNTLTGNLARGIMQVIPPTFRSFALPGHGNIMNPVDNIIAGSRYAMSKYGAGWFNPGPRHSHGYEGGGIVGVSGGVPFGGARAVGGPVSADTAYLVGERGPEMIVPSSAGRVVDSDDTRERLGTGRRGDVYFQQGAIVVNGARDPRATADEVAEAVADRIARS